MYASIESNVRRSYFLIAFFLILVMAVAWIFTQVMNLG